MPKNDKELATIIVAQLTPEERKGAVAYVSSLPVPAEAQLKYLPISMHALPWDACMAFIDQEPMANWGHASRAVFVNRNTGEAFSIAMRFPPFNRNNPQDWQMIYQAPGVPDAVLLTPK